MTVVVGPSCLLCGYHVNLAPLSALFVHLAASMLADCYHVPDYMIND